MPAVNQAASPHHLFWMAGYLVGGVVALILAHRENLPLGRCAIAWVVMMMLGLLGARLYYIVDNGVPMAVWARQGPLAGGIRIPGALLAILFVMPFFLRALRLPILPVADALIPASPLGLALGRIHCFVAGCCFGQPTDLPWAVQFGGALHHVRLNHLQRGLIPPEAQFSLPVHPLQVYFALAALALGLFLLWFHRRRSYDGEALLVFIAVYAFMKISLETLRERTLVPDAPDPFWIGIVFGMAATALLVALRLRPPEDTGGPGRKPGVRVHSWPPGDPGSGSPTV